MGRIRNIVAGLAFLGLLVACGEVSAQAPATVKLCVQSGTTCTPITSANPFPVTLGGSGTGAAVFGPTAVGSAAANPPVQIGGTATGTSTSNVENATVKAASTAPVTATDTALVTALRPDSPGIVALGQATAANSVPVVLNSDGDPCGYAKKSSVKIAVTSATTTSLVAVSGSTTVYVCGFSMSIAASATTATSAKFEYGTSSACSSPTDLTGIYGSNDAVVSPTPTVVSYGDGHATIFASAASNGVCIVTAGSAVQTEGVLTYVQQ